jgi:hypothetical protein
MDSALAGSDGALRLKGMMKEGVGEVGSAGAR